MIHNFLIPILFVAFFIRTLRATLFLVGLWQLKEYRIDRLWVHLTTTKQGRDLVFGKVPLIGWLLIFLYPLTFISTFLRFTYPVLVTAFVAYEAYLGLVELTQKTIKRPAFTLKAVFVAVATISFETILIFLPLIDVFTWILILEKLLPVFVAGLIFCLAFPTELMRDKTIFEAARKLSKNKKLTVIGITGSYGKSSTKEYVAHILSRKFNVVKTPGTNNTPIGIAKTILNSLNNKTEIFVVEMGAYKRGEIKEMCQLVHPKIGVLTGISPQHLSLFGSMQNILRAKYELIESLPKDGLAIFNGNNKYTRELYKKTVNIKRRIYSFFQEDSDIQVKNIRASTTGISFKVKLGREWTAIRASLLGRHNVENFLCAILVARSFKMKPADIQMAVSSMSPLPMTMKAYKLKNGATIIDDTFNASPDAVISAIFYMNNFRGKRVLVFQPMIELGSETKNAHREVGKLAGSTLSKIFLTNKNWLDAIKQGVREKTKREKVEVANSIAVLDYVRQLGREDVVVFEGKEAEQALKKVLSIKWD